MKQSKNVSVFRACVIIARKMYRAYPGLFVVNLVFLISVGVVTGGMTPAQQLFFDRATDLVGGHATLAQVLVSLALLAIAFAIAEIFQGIHLYVGRYLERKAYGPIAMEIHGKMGRIAPVAFEDTDMLDNINKAVEGAGRAVDFTGRMITTVFALVPFYLFMSVYLFMLSPLLALSMLMVLVPSVITQFLRAKNFAKVEDASAPVRRELTYYESCMAGRELFKETRIIGAFAYFKGLYIDCVRLLNKLVFRAAVKSDFVDLGMKLISLAGYVGIILMLFHAIMNGNISVGAFAAVFAAIGRMFGFINGRVSSTVGYVAREFGKVQNYLRFLNMPERGGEDVEIPTDGNITLEGVSFAYPGMGVYAVDNVSVTIHNGETIAIVGENGSGKSTLVRLITGLYLPTAGDVTHGGVSTKTASEKSLFENTTAVFQRFQRYQMTLGENIAMSDVNAPTDHAALNSVSAEAGIEAGSRTFTEGYDTMLSREFDGVDLSGGQWQRVAIARGLFRKHQLVVLDEPTAAIDPIEETNIYNRFAEISKDKTAITVTHRLGSAKLADRILVMRQGKLVEEGRHDELVEAGGEYARLYAAQEQWYIDN